MWQNADKLQGAHQACITHRSACLVFACTSTLATYGPIILLTETLLQEHRVNSNLESWLKREKSLVTLNEKRQILAEVDRKVKSKTDICKEYGLAKSTLSTFIKNRVKIENIGQPEQKWQRV